MKTRGGAVMAAILAVLTAAACRPPTPTAPTPGGWVLVHPPDLRNAEAPGGFWLLPEQPIERWQPTGSFDTEPACDAARRARINDTIDSARRRVGLEAKFDVDVRRAVNACCVPAGATGEALLTCRRDGASITPP